MGASWEIQINWNFGGTMPPKPGDPLSSSTVALVRVSDHLPHTWSEEVLIERWTVKQTGALIPALCASPKSIGGPIARSSRWIFKLAVFRNDRLEIQYDHESTKMSLDDVDVSCGTTH